MFVNPPGVTNFRALRVESGDQHLYWQPTYQHLLRVEGAFGEFFPQAEFSDNGNQVIFTKYVDSVEVLSLTRALKAGERIPRGEWQRFLDTWANFKRLADRTDIPEDVRNFIFKFGPPSVERYPAAYRIYRPHWYSKSRLFILWGLEPVGGADFVSVSPEQAISEGTARAETDGQETSGNFLRWMKIFLLGLLALAALLFLVWCCLPRPVVDFEVSAEVEKPAVTKNLTTLDRSWDWGSRDYHWSFAQGIPDSSSDFEPKPLWSLPGPHDVTLEVTQSTLWGLLYKTEAKTINVTVTVPPKPPAIILPPSDLIPGVIPSGPKSVGPDGIPGAGKPTEGTAPSDKMIPGAPKPAVPDDTPGTDKPADGTKPNDKMIPGKPKTAVPYGAPSVPAPATRPQTLSVPRVVIEGANAFEDGKSQDIEFSLKLPDGVKLEHLYLDDIEISVASDGSFKRRLPMGPHTLRIEYGSSANNSHGQVTQELMVDADQVQVITPKNRIAPPVKVPGSDQPVPALPTKPKDEAAEKFDKKTA